MATINELTRKRENLLIQIAGVTADLKEYTKYPVETIDVEQIKYQYGFILREIKDIDEKLKFIFLTQSETLKTDLEIMDKEMIESVAKNRFTVTDLPKLHYSMFDEPFI
ncbi:hypothetical protein [Flavobacterium gawalongense]|uniref:Uncharacterized protein n=1 Tax=Flavobacterium gawalongense TaxID=2594432 RepID=A0A553BD85_9FLAO|nr:hypothetical protein [Flavobacterium gawalongense]TRW98495.1 hypothetical protein FNW33_15915 [Flavobacterium gawalongense]TRX02872.1 hypothetical protein FNW12_15820 [Flavobacterium gawalongense]TRX06192.1 hypothetical protein FNW11_14935 [Flavobacterium gawalongense]TRX06924.1 hypothetical protein FNW10_15295 [Flavobacterium gawalongense]TRX22554.1 hypothetical protein FNW38_15545 [Flavobacterium gawalongense]